MPDTLVQNRRVALVTGGAVRVGRAIVEKLAEEGFTVAFTYLRSESEANELSARIGGRAIRADLANPNFAASQILSDFSTFSPRLDVLVNNASLYQSAGLRETSVELCRRLMAIHYESPLLLARTFEPMLRASCGHIINMCDLLAERPWPDYLAYCASKAALANLTLSLARAMAPEVTVNGIAPGVVEWPDDYPQSERDKYLLRVPLARAGTGRDVASLVHFLATEGSYITGQIIRVDGGRSMT